MRIVTGLFVLLVPCSLGAQTATTCGVERWPVKTMVDDDTGSVDHAPQPTTIASLTSLPRTSEERTRRGRVGIERRTFRIRGMLREVRPQPTDGDIHLVLADPADPRVTMVAEIPDSLCALTSRHASDFAEARRVLERIPLGGEIEVEGVAFWDDEHGQRGMAENGIELHPVLRISPVLTGADLAGEIRDDRAVDAESSDSSGVRVWVNTSSNVYHCPDSEFYGRTARGKYLPESVARQAGARPAGGRRCR